MKKIIHIACLTNPGRGIVNQMLWEHKAATELEYEFRSIIFTNDTFSNEPICYPVKLPKSRFFAYIKLRLIFLKWVIVNRKKYDLFLFRYSIHDPFLYIATLFVNKYYTVHHTFEIEEIAISNFFPRLRIFLEKFFGKIIISKSSGIIGVTNEICQYELKRINHNSKIIVYPNGVESEIVARKVESNQLNCIFVSSEFQAWTGIDYLIDEYYQFGTVGLTIHLVGRIPNELFHRISKSELFVIHGEKSGNELLEIYSTSVLAISSFGFNKKNMHEACPLKSREYLSLGIPVVGGYIDAALPMDFPFYKKSGPSLIEIKKFAEKVRNVSRYEVRDAAKPFISKKQLLEGLIKSLNQ